MARNPVLVAFRGLLLLAFHLVMFAACLLGAGGVLAIMGGLLFLDLLAGVLAGDLRRRWRRRRW